MDESDNNASVSFSFRHSQVGKKKVSQRCFLPLLNDKQVSTLFLGLTCFDTVKMFCLCVLQES